MSGEFDLIARYFDWRPLRQTQVVVGVGDDAAVLEMPTGCQLVVTADTLIESVHFPARTDPYSIAVKSLAVNLSDLAAMAAEPAWFTLSLSLPQYDPSFLEPFSQGLRETAERYRIDLVGGDTTRGELSISIQAMGWVPRGEAVLRSGAISGDDVYVTGDLGAAALGLMFQETHKPLTEDANYCLSRLNRPEPRSSIGLALRSLANAMIDCSDGFLADLSHLAKASDLAALVERNRLPLSAPVSSCINEDERFWRLPLAGGDDYELIFTARPGYRNSIQDLVRQSNCPITRVGVLSSGAGVSVLDEAGRILDAKSMARGYSHF